MGDIWGCWTRQLTTHVAWMTCLAGYGGCGWHSNTREGRLTWVGVQSRVLCSRYVCMQPSILGGWVSRFWLVCLLHFSADERSCGGLLAVSSHLQHSPLLSLPLVPEDLPVCKYAFSFFRCLRTAICLFVEVILTLFTWMSGALACEAGV